MKYDAMGAAEEVGVVGSSLGLIVGTAVVGLVHAAVVLVLLQGNFMGDRPDFSVKGGVFEHRHLQIGSDFVEVGFGALFHTGQSCFSYRIAAQLCPDFLVEVIHFGDRCFSKFLGQFPRAGFNGIQ